MIKEEPVLRVYDNKHQTKLAVDASKQGLGATLLTRNGDHWRPMAYASGDLTATACQHAQKESDALSLVRAYKKCSLFLYGIPVLAGTDHKPLVVIAVKGFAGRPPR